MGENRRTSGGVTFNHGSYVERLNSSGFVYRDAQSRLVCNPATAQSPLTSRSKDNPRQDTSYHPCCGLRRAGSPRTDRWHQSAHTPHALNYCTLLYFYNPQVVHMLLSPLDIPLLNGWFRQY